MAPKLVFIEKLCTCGKTFETSNDSALCYDCTLGQITHGMPPEEGDFNTAKIVSGTLTETERRYLQSDLQDVELGRTTQELYEEEEYEEPDDPWEYNEQEAARFGDEG